MSKIVWSGLAMLSLVMLALAEAQTTDTTRALSLRLDRRDLELSHGATKTMRLDTRVNGRLDTRLQTREDRREGAVSLSDALAREQVEQASAPH